MAEIIPFEPDPGNAGAGKSYISSANGLPLSSERGDMTVFLNNESVTLQETSTLAQLLEEKNMHQMNGIAVAVNRQVVPRAQWSSTNLKTNDNIIIIKATQGG